MAPVRTKTNILIGTATLYVAPAYTPMPDDTVGIDGDWGALWVHPGYTEEGVSTSFERDTEDHNVEEDPLPAFRTVTSATFTVTASFAEDTLENIKLAMGGGIITTTAAGTGQIGKKRLVLSEELEELALGFEGKNAEGYWRRIYIPRVVASGTVETEYRRAAQKRVYPAEFASICALSEIETVNMTAPATA